MGDQTPRRGGRRQHGAALAAIVSALAASGAARAESEDGLALEKDCAALAYMITPEGSRVLAVAQPQQPPTASMPAAELRSLEGQGPEAVARALAAAAMNAGRAPPTARATSWDLIAGRTHRFSLTGVYRPPGGAAAGGRVRAFAVPVDEASFRIPGSSGGYELRDIETGERIGEAPPNAPAARAADSAPVVISMGPQPSDRRGAWVGRASPAPADGQTVVFSTPEQQIEALDVRTAEVRVSVVDPQDAAAGGEPGARLLAWRLGRDGSPALRVIGASNGPKRLQLRRGDEWRTVLAYDYETLELLPPDDFGPDTESMFVVSSIGRLGRAAGRLDLATGGIAYVRTEDRRDFVDVQLTHDSSGLLWESHASRSADGSAVSVTVGTAIVGPVAAPGSSARAYDVVFGSPDAEALYDSLRGAWGHVSVLDWTRDGTGAVILLWGPGGRRRVEAVAIVDGRSVSARHGLCDTAG